MSLRWKIALATAALVAVAAIVFGTASYRSTKARLLDEVDRSLIAIDAAVDDRRLGRDDLPQRGVLSGFAAQAIGPLGTVRESTFTPPLPVTEADTDLIGRRASRFSTVRTEEGSFRVRTIGFPRGAIQVGRSLDETDRILASLRTRTLLLAALVSGIAAAAGFVIAGRVTASLRRLTAAAEHVESTGRLDVNVPADGADEVGRLSSAFAAMIAALARSRDQQQRLVQDAGHELRTPLTSLRTNVDVLRRYPAMPADDRDAVLTDLHAETEALTALVDEVVSLASGAATDEAPTRFDLAELAAELAARHARRTGREVRITAQPAPVIARRSAVQRAIDSLLDNATKFDDTGGPIDVTVDGASVVVADRGPGIAADDLDRVFDRFHRAAATRTLPGSGLGLAIVHDVATRHGGSVFARARIGGGAEVGFDLDQA